MSSDRPARRRRPAPHRITSFIVLLTAAILLTTACGNKKAPTPPPSKVPQKPLVRAHQRGSEAVLSFPFPSMTISGTLLPGVSRIEIWQLAREVPEFAVEMLLEEDAERQAAQALLDELGLPLYEVVAPIDPATGLPIPPTDPGTGLPIAPTDPATGLPVEESATDATFGDPSKAPPAEATAPQPEAPVSAEPVEDALVDDAAADETEGTGTESVDGAESSDEGEAGEGTLDGEVAPIELSEEEQLAIRVEAARNLLRSPPTPKETFISATSKEFKQESELALELEGDDIKTALIGENIVLRLPFPNVAAEGGDVGFLFAAKVFSANGKPSDMSVPLAILPVETPTPPSEVVVTAEATGIRIEWSAEEDPTTGFRIYRRDAQRRTYGDPVGLGIPITRSFVDTQAIYGGRYIYGVTTVAGMQPLLESDISSEHEIDYKDHFGPAVPGGLVAFPATDQVRLLWTSVTDIDLAGYEVSRRASVDDEPLAITLELVTGGQYVDEDVSSGQTWFYSVVAIDQVGNRSEPSTETEVRVP